MTTRRSGYQIRSPPKEVFPESTLSPGGLQLTTLFWDTGILFHQGSHAGARVGNNFEPPHPIYWRRIPSPGGSFSLSDPISTFTSVAYQGGVHRRQLTLPRGPPSHSPLTHHIAGTLNECFSPGRVHVPIKHDNDQLASSENAVHHASEAGLGPVQNGTAPPGSSIDRQAGYYRGAGHPSAPMGNFTPYVHNRILQFQNATTQSTGHDRTAVSGGRNSNIDAGDTHDGFPLPVEHPRI
ncbi:hypothetical protein BJV74DRAFT_887951 [Russula compacta]|nr:hypothetical protein BJV74DRAFT_887951 [Russula compacta]